MLKAQAHKWTEHEAKKAKMIKEYNNQISFRADTLIITKISYVINSKKEATMKITREKIDKQLRKLKRLEDLKAKNERSEQKLRFVTQEGPLSQEKIDKQLRKLKRLEDLKAKNERSEQKLRFVTQEGPLSQEKIDKQLRKLKRLEDLKAKNERSEQKLRKIFNPAMLKAQAHKWTEHEAKKAKMIKEYNNQISFRADTLIITKISYVINSKKEATMKITRGDNPLN
nr:hypothetical protein [Tanacetum cinerariifolium]